MQHLLDLQANQIERILWNNGVQGRVLGGDVLPRVTAFHLSVASDQGDILAKLQRLAGTLALHLGLQGEIRIRRDQGWIVVEVPHGRFRPVHLLRLQRELADARAGTPIPTQAILLGLDEAGRILLLRPASPEVAHILIAGTTGSGKSSLMMSMALSLALNNSLEQVRLVLIDPKGSEFTPLAGLPHLMTEVVTGMDDLAVLERLIIEMEQRGERGVKLPRLYVFLDEVADLMFIGGKPFQGALTRLTQRGRGAGIHIIAGTQKPTAEVMGTLVKANFPTRIVGAVVSPEDAKVAAGTKGTGAERLEGRGDFLLVTKGRTIRFQAAYVSPVALPDVVASLAAQRRSPTGRRWVVSDEDPTESVSSRLRKLIPFPFGGRGGHNRSDPSEAIADAQAGMSAWELRRKYGRGGSWAERMVKEYGPVGSGTGR